MGKKAATITLSVDDRAFLEEQARARTIEFVFTPKHGSWLNLVEGFFSKLTRQSLKGIRVKTKEELVERIYKYFEEVNADPVIYHWKYHPDEIDPSEQVQVETLPLKKSS